jgi:hypothetical protein
MQDRNGPGTTIVGRGQQGEDIDADIVLSSVAQMCQQGPLQINDDILHLLARNRVAFFVPGAEAGSVCVPVGEDVLSAAGERQLEVVGGLLPMLVPFLFDGAEQLVSIVIGGDD